MIILPEAGGCCPGAWQTRCLLSPEGDSGVSELCCWSSWLAPPQALTHIFLCILGHSWAIFWRKKETDSLTPPAPQRGLWPPSHSLIHFLEDLS